MEGRERPPGPQEGPPSNPVLDGRDPRGRFEVGNALGRGHVVNRKISELRRVALASETPEQVAGVIAKMREMGMSGDTTAARIYIETMIGKPVQGVEVSGVDGTPLSRSAEVAAALSVALSPFSEEVRFAVLGTLKRTIDDAGRAE